MIIQEIKDEQQKKVDEVITRSKVFFAFNQQQLDEGISKTPLEPGDKYIKIFGGGIMPKSLHASFNKGLDEVENWYKETVNSNNLREENILYELGNHEAWYTGEVEDTLTNLGGDYTEEEVWKIYYEHQAENQE